MEKFTKRAVKYLGLTEFGDWKFKLYSMKYNELRVTPEIEKTIKAILPDWIKENSQTNDFPNYKIGTVIIHEAMDSILVVVNWWVYENVIQNHVYCSEYEHSDKFEDISSKGLRFCVWEMNILWHERNLWVEHVLKKSDNPDWDSYLNHSYKLEYAD
ncbi:MAG: hypothetical protein Mars2KO_19760 [Maribacter sp.]